MSKRFLRMKKFLLLSNYAPKPGFKYPRTKCPLEHREQAHNRIQAFERFWPEGVLWRVVRVEETSLLELQQVINNETWDAIWLSGSPYLLSDSSTQSWIKNLRIVATNLLKTPTPVFGICFGLQILSVAAGAKVAKTTSFLSGEIDLIGTTGQKLVKTALYHENYVTNLPETADILGSSRGIPYLVQLNSTTWGIQSHPELPLNSAIEQMKAEKFWQEFFVSRVSF